MNDELLIDGSYGEGGGQVIRTSVALAAITGRAIRIVNVRAGRAKPGLKSQHVVSVRAAAQICSAQLQGDVQGSSEFTFRPGHPVRAGRYRFDIGTAGSTVLVAQTVFVPLALAEGPSDVTITGGTHNDFAPSADFFSGVFLRAMEAAGVEVEFELVRHGFVPGGQGQVLIGLKGDADIQGLNLARRGRPTSAAARVVLSKSLPQAIGLRGTAELQRLSDLVPELRLADSATPGAASHIACDFDAGFAGFAGFVGLGAKGKPIEKVVAESGDAYRKFLKTQASVDEHLADQLVLPMAFATGPSHWVTPMVTEHLRTVIWVVGRFLDRPIVLTEHEDGSGVVAVS